MEKLKSKSQKSVSWFTCVICSAALLMVIFSQGNFKTWRNPFVDDVKLYYAYLPALFIHHDIFLHYTENDSDATKGEVDPIHLPNGNRLIKMTCGTAVCYSPFFFLAHMYSLVYGEATGYSTPYSVLLILGGAFYAIVSLFVLRRILLRYFSDVVTALTLASIMLGTNLFYYSSYEALMSHVYVFFTFVMVIEFTIRFHEKPSTTHSMLLGFFCGMAVLIRPNNGLIVLFPILYQVTSRESWREKLNLFRTNFKNIALAILAFLIPCSLQLWYWKLITGHWIFYSYLGEPFYFNDPQILNGLFSYRKGWLVYSPIMIFSLLGFFFSYNKLKPFFFPMVLILLLNVYVIFSWWCWWYGGSFGMRAMIDSYALLAFPIAAFYEKFFRNRITKGVVILLSCVLIALNLFQTMQYRRGIIHYDSMTKDAYWYVFLKPSLNEEQKKKLDDLIEFPHYDWWKDRVKYKEQLDTRQHHE